MGDDVRLSEDLGANLALGGVHETTRHRVGVHCSTAAHPVHDLKADRLHAVERLEARLVLRLALHGCRDERHGAHRGSADHSADARRRRHHVAADAHRVLVVENAFGCHCAEGPDEIGELLALEADEDLLLGMTLVVAT